MSTFKQEPLRILTLDGGGYRGIASLIILRSLLMHVDPVVNEGDHMPGKYFDLIGGTSTGGLIAIMFGRLGMTVQQAIDKYKSLGPVIFAQKGSIGEFIRRGHRINTEDFDGELEKWLGDDALYDAEPGKLGHTPCFVTTVPSQLLSHATPTLLRSYAKPKNCYDNSGLHKWLVREAARATSAALTYFEPLSVDGYSFKDAGASGFNNPAMVAMNEVHVNDLFRKRAHFCCLVSLGTGLKHLNKKPQESARSGWFPSLGTTINEMKGRVDETINDLVSAATDTETVHHDASFHLGYDSGYFRFDPDNGVGDFVMDDVFRGAELEVLTVEYLKKPGTQKHLEVCASKLKGSQRVPREAVKHASLFGEGYAANFIKPIVDMVWELRLPRNPATLCDPVARANVPPILGLIVVMPQSGNVQEYQIQSNTIKQVLIEYEIKPLILYGQWDMRTVYYAYNFVIDFPRTLSALSHPDDPAASGETETFQSRLNEPNDNPRASVVVTVVAWERFIEIMKHLKARGDNPEAPTWQQLEQQVPPGGAVLHQIQPRSLIT